MLKSLSHFSGQNLLKGDALYSLAKKYQERVETYDMAAVCYIKLFAKNITKDKRALVNTVPTDFLKKYCSTSCNEIQQTLRDIVYMNISLAYLSNLIERPLVENYNQAIAADNLKIVTNSSPSQLHIAGTIRDEMFEKYKPHNAVDEGFMKPLRNLFKFAPAIVNVYTVPPSLSK